MKASAYFLFIAVMACFNASAQNFRLYHKQNLFEISNNPVCHYTRQITMKLSTMDNPETKFMDYLYAFGTRENCYPILGCFYKEIKQSVVEYNRLWSDTAGGYMVFDHNPIGLKKHSTIAVGCSNQAYGEVQYMNFDYTNYIKKNIVSEVYGHNNHMRYNGDFVCVPESLTAPKILSPNVNGLVTAPEMRFRAPDFLANNFDPLDIYWYVFEESYGYENGKPKFRFESAGTELLYLGQKCKPMQIYAIVKKNKYNWQTSTINFQHSPYPNLELGKTLILTQPKCVDPQSNGDDSKTVAHLSLDKSIFGRTFLLTYVDKNGVIIDQFTLDNEPNNEQLKIEESPYQFIIEEIYPVGISCEQFIDSVKILAPVPIDVVATSFTDIACHGDRPSLNIHIKGGTSTYQLDYGIFGAQVGNDQNWYVPLSKGSRLYDFKITDRNGCVYDKEIKYTATEPTAIQAVASLDSVLCYNGLGKINIVANGGTPFDTINPYKYSFESVSNTLQTSPQYTAKGGSLVYPKVYDKNNCSYVLPATELNNPQDFNIKVNKVVNNSCPKAQLGEVHVSCISQDPKYTYSYHLGQADPIAEGVFKNLPSGYQKVFAQNNKGCHKDTTILVNEPPIIQIINAEERKVRCEGENNGGFTLKILGGTGSKSIWHSPNQLASKHSNAVFFQDYDSLTAGAYTFYVRDSLGCQDSTSFTLGTSSKLTHSLLLKENPACNESSDGSIRVRNEDGVAPYRNIWLDTKANNDTTLTRLGLGKGDYILSTIDALGCTQTDTFRLVAPTTLQVDLKGYPLICKGQSLDLDAGSGGIQYEWTSNNGFKANTRNVTLYFEGAYYVQVKNRYGCVGRDTFLLKQSDTEIKTDFLMPSKAVKGDTVVLLNTDAKVDSIRWGFDNYDHKLLTGNPDFRAQELVFHTEGEHGLTMTSYYKGCRDVRKRTITIIPPHERNNNDRSLGMKVSIVKECSLHPNPNNGSFKVSVDLNEPNIPVELTLASVTTGSVLRKLTSNEYSEHRVEFDEDLPDGAYAVYIKVKNEVFMLRFLVTNE